MFKYKQKHASFGKQSPAHFSLFDPELGTIWVLFTKLLLILSFIQRRESMSVTGSEPVMRTGSLLSARRVRLLSYQTQTRRSKPFSPTFAKSLLIVLFNRFLVPNDLCAYQFNFIIRKRINLPENDSLYFFVNGKYLLKAGMYSAIFYHIITKLADNYGIAHQHRVQKMVTHDVTYFTRIGQLLAAF